MNERDIDSLLAALANPARRRMIDAVEGRPGVTIAGLTRQFAMSGVGVLKHVRVLEEAGVITSQQQGRRRMLFFNSVPIQRLCDHWSARYATFWSGRMADLKERVESASAEQGAASGGVGGAVGGRRGRKAARSA